MMLTPDNPWASVTVNRPSPASLVEALRALTSVLEAERSLIEMLVGLLERWPTVTQEEIQEALRRVRSVHGHTGGFL